MNLAKRGLQAAELKRSQRLKTTSKPKPQPATPTVVQSYDPTTGTYTVREGGAAISGCTAITNGTLAPGQIVIRKGNLIDAQRTPKTKPTALPSPPPAPLNGVFLFFDAQILHDNTEFAEQFLMSLAPEIQLHRDYRNLYLTWEIIPFRETTILDASPALPLVVDLFLPVNEGSDPDHLTLSVELTDAEKTKLHDMAKETAVVLVSDWNDERSQLKARWISHAMAHWAIFGYDAASWTYTNNGIPATATIIDSRFGSGTVDLDAFATYDIPSLPGVDSIIDYKNQSVAAWIQPDAITDPIPSRVPYFLLYQGDQNG